MISPFSQWNHISNLSLADPDFGTPGRIDLLLGADIYADVLLHGQWCGPPGTPTILEHNLDGLSQVHSHSTNHTSVATYPYHTSGDGMLSMFWENLKDLLRGMLGDASLQR